MFCPYCGLDPVNDGHITERHGISAEQHDQNLRKAKPGGVRGVTLDGERKEPPTVGMYL